MADMQSDGVGDTRVQVQIGGRSYTLRGGRDPVAVQELAAFVDQRMNEIAARTRTADTTRLAILAALNIAADLHKTDNKSGARTRIPSVACSHEARDRDLCRILDTALSG